MELLVAQLLNGLVYGVLLFLMAAGLSLIFGLMNVVSLAHGSFFMLGAFLGLAVVQATGSFWLALLLAPLAVAVLGVVMEVIFLRPLYARGHMDQVLLTFGFTFVFLDLVQTIWGRSVQRLPVPEALQGTMQIADQFPVQECAGRWRPLPMRNARHLPRAAWDTASTPSTQHPIVPPARSPITKPTPRMTISMPLADSHSASMWCNQYARRRGCRSRCT